MDPVQDARHPVRALGLTRDDGARRGEIELRLLFRGDRGDRGGHRATVTVGSRRDHADAVVVRARREERAAPERVAERVRDRDCARRTRLLAHEAALALEDARLGLEQQRDEPAAALREDALLIRVLAGDGTRTHEVLQGAEHPGDDPEHLAIHLAEHDVDGSEDRDHVRDETALEQPRQDLKVHEGCAAHLCAERGGAAAVADHVEPDLALGALDRVVGLPLWALPYVAETRAHRSARQLVDALADQRDRQTHLTQSHLVARERVALGEDDRLHGLELGIDGVRPVHAQVPAHAGGTQHRAGHGVLLRHLGWDAGNADGALEEDLVALEDLHVVVLDVLLPSVEEPRELRDPTRWEVVHDAARPEEVVVHARAAELLDEVEDLLAVAEAPQHRGRRAHVEAVRAEPHEVAGAPRHLVDDDADELRATRYLDARDRLGRTAVRVLVQHRGDVVGLVRVTRALVEGPPLVDLLETPVQVPHHRDAFDDLLAGEPQHQAQDAMRRGMLGSQIQDQLLGLEALVLDDRKLDAGTFADLANLGVGGAQCYPPFAIFSRSRSTPSVSASGRGGQPGTYTSTGTIVSTPWSVE